MLIDAGWVEGRDWLNEVELPGMPNKQEVGYADYVLYDDTHKPLAVIEAKRMCVDPSKAASKRSCTPTSWRSSMAVARWCS